LELLGVGGLWWAETDDYSTRWETMNTIIKTDCLIGFACAMATPAFAAEQKIILMIGGKFCEAYLGDAGRVGVYASPSILFRCN
jgi:hypothetical protein